MADDDEDVAALVVDNGSGMCKGKSCLRSLDSNLQSSVFTVNRRPSEYKLRWTLRKKNKLSQQPVEEIVRNN